MDLTVVLVGPRRHGKSETGNSILGRNAFISSNGSSNVTETCELQTKVMKNGHTISVIDTPGFVDTKSELLGEEVKKCINLAGNGVHAVLFVVKRLFSEEDQILSAIRNLQTIFGENIIKSMIVVLTFPDVFMALSLPLAIHNMIRLCEGRYIILDNTTKNAAKKSKQVQNLLSQVETIISHNGGKPFMSQVPELQLQAATLKVDEGAKGHLKEEISEQIDESFEERMTQRINVVESTMIDATTRLEQRLVEAHATTMNAEEISKLIQEQTTHIVDAVEARLRDTTTRLEQQLEAATLKADDRAEKYFKEATSELIQRMSKSYEEQIMQRLEAAVEQRVSDMATRLEQQQAEAHASHIRVNEIAQCKILELIQQMTHRFNEEVESGVKDVTTRLEQQLEQAEAARLKADERAQEAQKNSDEQIQKLKEVLQGAESRRSQTILEFESSSFHVYDPSTYELQSTIK